MIHVIMHSKLYFEYIKKISTASFDIFFGGRLFTWHSWIECLSPHWSEFDYNPVPIELFLTSAYELFSWDYHPIEACNPTKQRKGDPMILLRLRMFFFSHKLIEELVIFTMWYVLLACDVRPQMSPNIALIIWLRRKTS